MKDSTLQWLAGTAFLALVASAQPSRADSFTEQLASSVKESTVDLSFRYRFEAVDDAAFAKDAWANTLRSRLTVAPKPISGFGVLFELDDVRHIGADNFNDSRNGRPDRPAVTDPQGLGLNQALLRYTGFAGTEFIAGRQRINRANERFVGGVGWRQNEQTFDAVGVSHKFGDRLTASYSYIAQVNRIQGPDNGTPPARFDSSSHLFDVAYTFAPALTLAAYGYLMDFSNAASSSNETFGLRGTGSWPLGGDWKLNYAAEFARQSDYADNPVHYDANYYLVEVGAGAPRIGVKVGYEVLEGNSKAGAAFRTPLATLHAFQGWADKFLTTPDRGVRDLYVAITGKALGADLLLRFHDFNAETGSGHWGTEVDFSANWPIARHYAVLLKGATYDADDFAANTNKYWVMLTASF